MQSPNLFKRLIPPIIPYLAVTLGLIVFHNAWLAILVYHAAMLTVLLTAKEKLVFNRLFYNRNYFVVLASAAAGAAGGGLVYFLLPWLSVKGDILSYTGSIGLIPVTWLGFVIYFVLVNPVIEEYYWRGLLAGEQKGLTLNDGLFSGYHVIVLAGHISRVWLVASFVVLTLAAWFWRQMNRRNGGLLASIVSHLAADIAVMFAILVLSGKPI